MCNEVEAEWTSIQGQNVGQDVETFKIARYFVDDFHIEDLGSCMAV